MKKIFCIIASLFIITMTSSFALEWSPEADAAYVKTFEKKYPPVDAPPVLSTYATAKRYDDYFMGAALEKVIATQVQNDKATLAWGTSPRIMSLNSMYRATGDEKYLKGNLRLIRAILAQRDDKRGIALWTGQTSTVWGCEKYVEKGRTAFACHTGMVLYPMFDCLMIIKIMAFAFISVCGYCLIDCIRQLPFPH